MARYLARVHDEYDKTSGFARLETADGRSLVERVGELGDPARPTPAELARLRKHADAELVARAIEVVAARRRASGKLASSETLWADRSGVEQASGTRVARYKAHAIAERTAAQPTRLLDLCCGIGGDAIELARVFGAERVVAVDRDIDRVWCCSRNAGVESHRADVATWFANEGRGADLVHLDPARRVEGQARSGQRARRSRLLDDLEPGRDFVELVASKARGLVLKLSPGLDRRELDTLPAGELEFVAEPVGLVQALLWLGELQGDADRRSVARIRAESLDAEADELDVLRYSGRPRVPTEVREGQASAFLVRADPLLERAELVGARLAELGVRAAELWPGLGLLTSDEDRNDAWFDCERILDTIPARPRELAQWFAGRGARFAGLRSRGRVGSDEIRRVLKAFDDEHGEPVRVQLVRFGPAQRAILTLAKNCSD